MDKLTAIKVFLSIADTGSFTRTADQLDISKPMITRYVALMEEWLNARLFQRTTRKVSLTEAGEEALVFCQKILQLSDEMEQEMLAKQGELRGLIRICSNASFGGSHLTQAINRFLAQYPKVSIQLDLSDRLVDLIAERIDLAVRITNTPDPNLIARKVADCHSSLVAVPAYLAEFGEPKHPEDLQKHRYLTHANINRREWRFSKEGQEVLLELSSQFTTNETGALLTSVLAGNGIAMLPNYMVSEFVTEGKLKAVMSDWQLPKYSLYLMYPSRHKLPLVVRRLIDFLVEEFKDKSW
ncbi:LysR family transcriptional regulator [Pelistega suis]|uniref:LysR family transcriptional regulator n=1 Tax=Pelistega suis TaxID=1631957 RepID=UPI00211BDD62|nr:LysR family transcriptional regulator [Pelistega suis]MCQ9329791.1 LysR family transcriptional regulator [Pelistega suis]